MSKREEDAKHDQAVEDSFPASDPPASGVTVGPRTPARRPAPHERSGESRPKGTPTHERHEAETAYQWEHEKRPGKR